MARLRTSPAGASSSPDTEPAEGGAGGLQAHGQALAIGVERHRHGAVKGLVLQRAARGDLESAAERQQRIPLQEQRPEALEEAVALKRVGQGRQAGFPTLRDREFGAQPLGPEGRSGGDLTVETGRVTPFHENLGPVARKLVAHDLAGGGRVVVVQEVEDAQVLGRDQVDDVMAIAVAVDVWHRQEEELGLRHFSSGAP
jgi:hypothetical protein